MLGSSVFERDRPAADLGGPEARFVFTTDGDEVIAESQQRRGDHGVGPLPDNFNLYSGHGDDVAGKPWVILGRFWVVMAVITADEKKRRADGDAGPSGGGDGMSELSVFRCGPEVIREDLALVEARGFTINSGE